MAMLRGGLKAIRNTIRSGSPHKTTQSVSVAPTNLGSFGELKYDPDQVQAYYTKPLKGLSSYRADLKQVKSLADRKNIGGLVAVRNQLRGGEPFESEKTPTEKTLTSIAYAQQDLRNAGLDVPDPDIAEPTKRAWWEKYITDPISSLQYGLARGVKNLVDDDKSTGFFQGLGEGIASGFSDKMADKRTSWAETIDTMLKNPQVAFNRNILNMPGSELANTKIMQDLLKFQAKLYGGKAAEMQQIFEEAKNNPSSVDSARQKYYDYVDPNRVGSAGWILGLAGDIFLDPLNPVTGWLDSAKTIMKGSKGLRAVDKFGDINKATDILRSLNLDDSIKAAQHLLDKTAKVSGYIKPSSKGLTYDVFGKSKTLISPEQLAKFGDATGISKLADLASRPIKAFGQTVPGKALDKAFRGGAYSDLIRAAKANPEDAMKNIAYADSIKKLKNARKLKIESFVKEADEMKRVIDDLDSMWNKEITKRRELGDIIEVGKETVTETIDNPEFIAEVQKRINVVKGKITQLTNNIADVKKNIELLKSDDASIADVADALRDYTNLKKQYAEMQKTYPELAEFFTGTFTKSFDEVIDSGMPFADIISNPDDLVQQQIKELAHKLNYDISKYNFEGTNPSQHKNFLEKLQRLAKQQGIEFDASVVKTPVKASQDITKVMGTPYERKKLIDGITFNARKAGVSVDPSSFEKATLQELRDRGTAMKIQADAAKRKAKNAGRALTEKQKKYVKDILEKQVKVSDLYDTKNLTQTELDALKEAEIAKRMKEMNYDQAHQIIKQYEAKRTRMKGGLEWTEESRPELGDYHEQVMRGTRASDLKSAINEQPVIKKLRNTVNRAIGNGFADEDAINAARVMLQQIDQNKYPTVEQLKEVVSAVNQLGKNTEWFKYVPTKATDKQIKWYQWMLQQLDKTEIAEWNKQYPWQTIKANQDYKLFKEASEKLKRKIDYKNLKRNPLRFADVVDEFPPINDLDYWIPKIEEAYKQDVVPVFKRERMAGSFGAYYDHMNSSKWENITQDLIEQAKQNKLDVVFYDDGFAGVEYIVFDKSKVSKVLQKHGIDMDAKDFMRKSAMETLEGAEKKAIDEIFYRDPKVFKDDILIDSDYPYQVTRGNTTYGSKVEQVTVHTFKTPYGTIKADAAMDQKQVTDFIKSLDTLPDEVKNVLKNSKLELWDGKAVMARPDGTRIEVYAENVGKGDRIRIFKPNGKQPIKSLIEHEAAHNIPVSKVRNIQRSMYKEGQNLSKEALDEILEALSKSELVNMKNFPDDFPEYLKRGYISRYPVALLDFSEDAAKPTKASLQMAAKENISEMATLIFHENAEVSSVIKKYFPESTKAFYEELASVAKISDLMPTHGKFSPTVLEEMDRLKSFIDTFPKEELKKARTLKQLEDALASKLEKLNKYKAQQKLIDEGKVEEIVNKSIPRTKDIKVTKDVVVSRTSRFADAPPEIQKIHSRMTEVFKQMAELEELPQEIIDASDMYMAHIMRYDLKKTTEGRRILKELGLDGDAPINFHAKTRKYKTTIEKFNAMVLKKHGVPDVFETEATRIFLQRGIDHSNIMYRKTAFEQLRDTFGEKIIKPTLEHPFDPNNLDVEYVRQIASASGIEYKPGQKITLEQLQKMQQQYWDDINRKLRSGKYTLITPEPQWIRDNGIVLDEEEMLKILDNNNLEVGKDQSVVEVFKNALKKSQIKDPMIKVDLGEATVEEIMRKMDVDTYLVPTATYDAYTKMVQDMFERDKSVFLKFWDYLSGIFKTNATVMSAPFHTMNKVGNLHRMYMEYGADAWNPVFQIRSIQAMAGKGRFMGKTGAEWRALAMQYGVLDNDIFADAIPQSLKGLDSKNLPLTPLQKISRIVNPLDLKWKPYEAGRKLSSAIEGSDRMAAFLIGIDRGMSPQQAADVVDHLLFDYTDVTKFESDVMKRFAPFYTWIRKNIPLQIELLGNHPGRYANIEKILRAIEEEETEEMKLYKPKYLKNNSIHLGKGRYLNLNLPSSDLTKSFDSDELFSMLNPLVKTPLELIFNKNKYFDSPIQVRPGAMTKAPGYAKLLPEIPGVTKNTPNGKMINPKVKYAIESFMPSTKTLGDLINKAINEGTEYSNQRAINAMSGIRMYNVDPESAKQEALQRYLTKLKDQLSNAKYQGYAK